MSDYAAPAAKKSRYSRSELVREPRNDLVERCLKQQNQIDYLSSKQLPNEELAQVKDISEKLRAQLQESSQREGILVMRLTNKEQEVQDLLMQLQEMKHAQNPSSLQLQSLLVDPVVNLMFESIKKELDDSKIKLKQTQDDLIAYKFSPDSHIGKRLMARCHILLNENEDLGRMISSGSVAEREETIAMEKKFIQDMKKTEKDTEHFLSEINDEMEGMQATIYKFQQDLKECRDQLRQLQEENKRLRTANHSSLAVTNLPSEPATTAPECPTGSQNSKKRTEANADETDKVTRTTLSLLSSATAVKSKSRQSSDKASSERHGHKSSRSRVGSASWEETRNEKGREGKIGRGGGGRTKRDRSPVVDSRTFPRSSSDETSALQQHRLSSESKRYEAKAELKQSSSETNNGSKGEQVSDRSHHVVVTTERREEEKTRTAAASSVKTEPGTTENLVNGITSKHNASLSDDKA